MTSYPSFAEFFQALWAPHDPFPWQSMLAEHISAGPWPQALDLPTAAGKTACIDAAIYALASQAEKPVDERSAPRRIWFVVDRRIVVDEALERASIIAGKLREATDGPLKAVADHLRLVSGTERPLAVARLRGGVLRDDGWALDALRQRFGRLNRMGLPGEAPATVIVRATDTKAGQQDPSYGSAIAECWRLLNERASSTGEGKRKRSTIDFGFAALDAQLADEEDLETCLAPRPRAPILLPAHLDLLCQTAPAPRPDPDVQLFLHGNGRGAPEVRVVWRTDLLTTSTKTWKETVALCPPSTGDANAELILHLVASHHGHARPFAPISIDPAPPAVTGCHGGVDFNIGEAERSDAVAPHHLASGISERFWLLTRRCGWWGLAYLEAVLRLGDWYGSQWTADDDSSKHAIARPHPPLRRSRIPEPTDSVVLSGLDGANPRGFLAALGTLATLHQAGETDTRLGWKRVVAWQLASQSPDHARLRPRGVVAAYRARRLQVGNPPLHKINFSPARSV